MSRITARGAVIWRTGERMGLYHPGDDDARRRRGWAERQQGGDGGAHQALAKRSHRALPARPRVDSRDEECTALCAVNTHGRVASDVSHGFQYSHFTFLPSPEFEAHMGGRLWLLVRTAVQFLPFISC